MSAVASRIRRTASGPLICSIAGLAVLAGGVGWWPDGVELTLTPRGADQPLLVVPLDAGERFTLRYIHSVDHAPIWEEHSVDPDGTIYVEEERFVMFGAGMGHWPGHGTLTSRDGFQVIEDVHYPIGEFVLRVGSTGVDHTLMWAGGQINLSRLAAGQAVTVAARPARLWERLCRCGPAPESSPCTLADSRW